MEFQGILYDFMWSGQSFELSVITSLQGRLLFYGITLLYAERGSRVLKRNLQKGVARKLNVFNTGIKKTKVYWFCEKIKIKKGKKVN